MKMRSDYRTWLTKVDGILIYEVGAEHIFFEDFHWFDLWESEVTPAEAVEEFLDHIMR
jgi:hypothetical protein